MAKQTINLGTIPNSGLDGDDARTAFTKVNENFGELYTAMGGTGGTVSPKLTAIANSVWAANQLLMASGPNTLTMLASGATGRSLIAAADALAGRNVLGLGSASLLVATTSTSDVTAGRALRVGDSGLGAVTAVVISDANLNLPTGMFILNTVANGGLNGPVMDSFVGAWALANYSANATSGFQIASPQTGVAANKGRLFSRQVFSGTWSAWVELVTDATLGTIGWGAKGATGSTLVTGTDLNTMKVPGSYGQPANANATLALNYPTNQAGTLLVQAAGANIVTQQYTNYNSGRTWFRSAYNDVWSTWKEMPSIQDYGLGAIRSGEATYYIMLPSTPNNTAATTFIAANPTDDQAVAHQPVAGEEFGGVHVSRQLRPAQFGVSGRGANAKFFYRGYNSSTSALSEWFQAASVAYINSLGFGVNIPVAGYATNLDTLVLGGLYAFGTTAVGAPNTSGGTGLTGSLLHVTRDSRPCQMAWTYTSRQTWVRYSTGNSLWTPWEEVGAVVATALLAANGIGTTVSPNVTDLNLAVTGGTYRYSNTATNTPITSSGLVYVASYAATYVAQIVVTVQTNDASLYNRMFSRTMNQGTWGPWKEVFTGTTPLAGFAVEGNTAVVATDTLLVALGKLQGQLNATTPVNKGGTGGTTAAAARANLGLGTAAVAALTTSSKDNVTGRVTKTGDMGIGRNMDMRGDAHVTGNPSTSYGLGFRAGFVNGGSGDANSMSIPGLTGLNYGVLELKAQYEDVSGIDGIYREFTAGASGGPRKFIQSPVSATSWGPWTEMITKRNIVGAMSLTDGMSAVIERGGNANGEYIRFADGTQICWNSGVSASASAGGTCDYMWTFPLPFTNAGYQAMATAEPTGNWDHYGVIGSHSQLPNGIGIRMRNGVAGAQTFVAHVMAVGRWR